MTTYIGFVSDGEFSYLRTKGYTRPLSVLQIRSDVRRKYNRIKERCLLAMLTPKCTLSMLHAWLYQCITVQCKL